MLKAERQALTNTIREFAPFRASDAEAYTTNALEYFAHSRIREIDKKLAFRASPLQRIKQHTTVVEQLTGRLNDIESQIKSLSKEYHESYHKLSSAKRSLDRARHASLKQLSGKQKVEQFAAIGATFCEDLTQGLATQEASTFSAALKECVDKVKSLLLEKEAADQAASLAATPIQSPRHSPAPSDTRSRSAPENLSGMKGTPASKLSTPLSTNSLELSSAPEFGSRLPTAPAPRSQPLTVTKEAAEQHAVFLAQQVQNQAKAGFATFQEQARQQVASKITAIEQMEEENRQIKLAAERKVASLVQEGQELQGRTAGLLQQQQQDQASITRQTQLLHEKEAHTNDIQAKLDHLQAQHSVTLAAQGGEQELAQARIDAQLVEYESTIRGRVNKEAMAEKQRIQQLAH